MTLALKAPFPYPGGKSQIAPKVWELLGDPDHYIEPFAGSLAVLLARPHYRPGMRLHETVGDYSARIAHLWRAIKLRPAEVAEACVWPAHEIDYHARHAAILRDLPALKTRLLEDPDWCDPCIAGWEVWGLSMQIGNAWLRESRLGGRPCNSLKGSAACMFDPAQILALGDRLRHVATLYGDWRRCVSSKSTLRGPLMGDAPDATIGVFLDPPYTPALNRDREIIYHADEASIASDVRAWCAEWGTRPWLRIVLAGHAGEHDDLLAHGWRRVDWTTGGMAGGWARIGSGLDRQEALWASPACLTNDTPLLSWRSTP